MNRCLTSSYVAHCAAVSSAARACEAEGTGACSAQPLSCRGSWRCTGSLWAGLIGVRPGEPVCLHARQARCGHWAGGTERRNGRAPRVRKAERRARKEGRHAHIGAVSTCPAQPTHHGGRGAAPEPPHPVFPVHRRRHSKGVAHRGALGLRRAGGLRTCHALPHCAALRCTPVRRLQEGPGGTELDQERDTAANPQQSTAY